MLISCKLKINYIKSISPAVFALISGIAYKSCHGDDQEPWDTDVLQSPETNLTSDTVLTFQLSTERRARLDIYATSDVGHVAFRIATFSPNFDDSSSAMALFAHNDTEYEHGNQYQESNETFANETVCVPRNSHQLAFVAFALGDENTDSDQPDVIITDVLLTGTPCTAQSLPGKLNPPCFLRILHIC